jgi:putative integral membrane protein (TIGR02587 family)
MNSAQQRTHGFTAFAGFAIDKRKEQTTLNPSVAFAIGLARAFGGAIIFTLPMLMTMEMWQLGFLMSGLRLALLLLVSVPLLVGLSHYLGFEPTFGILDDLLDAFVAFAVGFFAAGVVLNLFAVINFAMSSREVMGVLGLQAVPGAIGAMFAQSQLGGGRTTQRKESHAGYGGEIFIMAAGALFLAFNVAPTEEMILIAYQTTAWHGLALVMLSLIVMHAFVYAVEFQGQASVAPKTPFLSVFLRYTVVGYAIALLISFYMLWTFGRADGAAIGQMISATIVLAFPAAVGAAGARLII